MCHLVFLAPILSLPVFWLLPASLALPIYLTVVGMTALVLWPVVGAMRQPRRVLRPDSEVVLLERMRPGGLLGRLVDFLDPLMSRLMGPHINRRILENVRRAGLRPVEERDGFWDWIKVIVARTNPI